MHREYVALKYPVMGMHQVEIHAADHPAREPCERQRAQEAREADHRDFVELDPV